MKLLSIEAATAPPTVALAIGESIVERRSHDPKAQAEQLLALVDDLLDTHKLTLKELDGVAVGRGPGSFTGLRVAAAMAQGLAYAAGLKVASISSLAATAHHVYLAHPECQGKLLVCLDARKEQVYCALYERDELGQPKRVSPEAVCDPDVVVKELGPRAHHGVGNGFAVYDALSQLPLNIMQHAGPTASAVALRAASGAVSFEPPYRALPEYVRDNVTHGS